MQSSTVDMRKYYGPQLGLFYSLLRILLTERQLRLIVSALALLEGMGSAVTKIHEVSGLGKSTIYRGAHEVVEIYAAIERGEGEQYWEAFSAPRPNNPFDEIYISPSTMSTDAPSSPTTAEKDNVESSEQSTTTDPSTTTSDSPVLKGICRKPQKRGRKKGGKTKPRRKAKKARDRRNLKGTVGRPPVYSTYPEIIRLVLQIICCYVYGDPITTHLWVSASQDHIRQMLSKLNVVVSDPTIGKLLWALGYSRQKNKKMLPVVNQHPDRGKEFERIKSMREYGAKREDWAILSADAKTRELIGNFARKGTEIREVRSPREVNDHDYEEKVKKDKEAEAEAKVDSNSEKETEISYKNNDSGHIIPYVVYDMKANTAFTVLGRNIDTPEFAIYCIGTYIKQYLLNDKSRKIRTILILCDGGGSNGSRCRMWKKGLAELAKELNIKFIVLHYPPGTSKWNPVEHRVLSEISKGWAGRPLLTVLHAVKYILASGTSTGLIMKCIVDETEYQRGKTLSQKEFDELMDKHIFRLPLCPQWGYVVYAEKPHYIDEEILTLEAQVLSILEAKDKASLDALSNALEQARIRAEAMSEGEEKTVLEQKIKSLADAVEKKQDSYNNLRRISSEVATMRQKLQEEGQAA